jgi:hypothetical protein
VVVLGWVVLCVTDQVELPGWSLLDVEGEGSIRLRSGLKGKAAK